MAEAPVLPLSGPPQRGQQVKGQYVYALIMPQPTPEVLERTGVKQPRDFEIGFWLERWSTPSGAASVSICAATVV